MCICAPHVYLPCASESQKKTLDYLGLALQKACDPPCRSWGMNPGLLEEQSVLFTIEPSLQFLASVNFTA